MVTKLVPVPLEDVVVALKDAESARTFLEAFLSDAELSSVRNRWLVIQMKRAGFRHREITKITGIAGGTISRASATGRKYSRFLASCVDGLSEAENPRSTP